MHQEGSDRDRQRGLRRPRIVPLDDVPEAAEIFAAELWRRWGFASYGDCAAHLMASRSGSIPSRFVAMADWPCGIVSLVESNLPARPHLSPWLAGLYVRSPFRRRGIGSALVRHAEAQASSIGIGQLFLYTPDAQPFYARLGWTDLESVVCDDRVVRVMARSL